MTKNPICSYCGNDINGDEILRSIAIIGGQSYKEYIICTRCCLHLSFSFRDHVENLKFKRINNFGLINLQKSFHTVEDFKNNIFGENL